LKRSQSPKTWAIAWRNWEETKVLVLKKRQRGSTPLAQGIGSSRRGKSPTQLNEKDTCSPSKDACSPWSVDSYGMIAMLPLDGTRPQYDNQTATPPQNMLWNT
jgi:hypothetical protein